MSNAADAALQPEASRPPATKRPTTIRRAPPQAATRAKATTAQAASASAIEASPVDLASPAAPAKPLGETLAEVGRDVWQVLIQVAAAIRAIPVPPAVQRPWEGLPGLGQAFVVLAIVDVFIRTFGLFGTSLGIDLATPRTLLTAFLPHNLLILLPAAILARRADATVATPLIFRGAVAIALTELLTGPMMSAGNAGANSLLPWVLVSVVSTGAVVAGWLALGIGLTALYPRPTNLTLLGMANLVGGVIVVAAVTQLLTLIVRPTTDLGLEAWNALAMIPSAVGVAGTIAWAYLAMVVVRGAADIRRPAVATYVAAGAMVVSTLFWLLVLVGNVLGLFQLAFGWPSRIPAISLGWFGTGLVTSGLVVAFAFGLADAAIRLPSKHDSVESEPESELGTIDDSPAWPTPGGDVPTFRQLEPDPSPKRRRSRRS